MTLNIAEIWRYPIKGHGRETIPYTNLFPEQTIPWDRYWAIAHTASHADGSQWERCVNFNRGAKAPELMAINTVFHVETKKVTVSHPQKLDLCFSPDNEADAFFDWVRSLIPEGRAQPARIITLGRRGMTDTDYPSISLINRASNADLGAKMGTSLDIRRWRTNFVIEGLSPWQEFDLIGKKLRIDTAILEIEEPIKRCLATAANPKTGIRDVDILGALNQNFGHQNFGLYAHVLKAGTIHIGAKIIIC